MLQETDVTIKQLMLEIDSMDHKKMPTDKKGGEFG
jgi:hypothetical protein